MMRDLSHIHNVIIKVGSSSLTDDSGRINDEKMLKIVSQLAYIKRKGMNVILVSSGAQAAGMGVLGLPEKPREMSRKQALAAIGQAKLMEHYEDLFGIFRLRCAQILVNHGDFDDRKRLANLSNAMEALLAYDVILSFSLTIGMAWYWKRASKASSRYFFLSSFSISSLVKRTWEIFRKY